MTSKRFNKTKTVVNTVASSVIIEQPQTMGICLEIVGKQPLIQNAFSQKAIEQMLRKHMGLSVQREAKKPRECIELATIRNVAGQVCVPPQGIKAAMLTASTAVKGMKKTQLRQALYIDGASVPITYEQMIPRMDMVRTSGMARTPDVRFRPEFQGWKARFYVRFSDTVAVQTVVDLVNRAGSVGLGEWRPEKNGTFGTFFVSRHINKPEEIAEVIDICSPSLVKPQIPEWAMDAEIPAATLRRIAAGDAGDEEGDEQPKSEEDDDEERDAASNED